MATSARSRADDNGQALPFAVMAITLIIVFITGETLVATARYREMHRNRANILLHNVNDWAIHTVNNLAAAEPDLRAVLWYDTAQAKPSKYRQWRTAKSNDECASVSTNPQTNIEQAIAKEPACWKVADLEVITGTTKGGITTDTIIVAIETRSECSIYYDDLNAVPSKCGASDYLILRYVRRTFLHYILHYDNDNLPAGPITNETVVAFHDVDDITGAIHTNLTSVLVCGGATTFQDATIETGGNSGVGNYANQCITRNAPPIEKQPINTGQLNVASFGTSTKCDTGQPISSEGLTPGRQWLRDAVRVVQGGVAGWVEATDGKVDLNDLINEDAGIVNAHYINDATKVVYSPGDILVQNTGSDKLTRPVTIIAGRDIILEGGDGPIGTTVATPPNVLALIAGCNLRIQYKRNPNMPPITPGTRSSIPEPADNQQGWCLTQLPPSTNLTPDLLISPRSVPIQEGFNATYKVKLASKPSNNVTVNVKLSDITNPNVGISVNPADLTFTEQDWDTEQTITLTTSADNDKNDDMATLEHTTSTTYTTDTDLVNIILYDGDNINTSPTPAEPISSAPTLTSKPSTGTLKSSSISGNLPASGDLPASDDPSTEVLAAELCDYMSITLDNVAILAPAGGIWVEEWSTPIRCDDQTPPACHTPTITINGSMAVHNRGLFGQYDAQTGELTTGYRKRFIYPVGMQHGITAWWPELEQGEWVPVTSSSMRANLMISPAYAIVNEDSTSHYTVKLATEPVGNVTVTISPKTANDLSISIDTDTTTVGNQNMLTFTSADWNIPQTVEIAAASDVDNLNGTAEFLHTSTSTDPDSKYNAMTALLTVVEADSSPSTLSLRVAGTP